MRPVNRRKFLKRVGTSLTIGGGFLGWATLVEPHWYEIVHQVLPIPNLPESWIGKRMVQLSDFHIGRTNLPYLVSVMKAVNELNADMHVLTGDFIDHDFPTGIEQVRTVFSTLKNAPLANIGCLGNHDYGHSWSNTNVADRVTEALNENGITILRDEKMEIQGLNVIGLDDYWSPRFQSIDIMGKRDPDAPSLCLCHNPDVCDLGIWKRFQGTILAGHTHGGQCKPPFLPPPRIPVTNKRYVNGFYDLSSNISRNRGENRSSELPIYRKLYINRGIGYGFKARFNCRPEVTVFKLARHEDIGERSSHNATL